MPSVYVPDDILTADQLSQFDSFVGGLLRPVAYADPETRDTSPSSGDQTVAPWAERDTAPLLAAPGPAVLDQDVTPRSLLDPTAQAARNASSDHTVRQGPYVPPEAPPRIDREGDVSRGYLPNPTQLQPWSIQQANARALGGAPDPNLPTGNALLALSSDVPGASPEGPPAAVEQPASSQMASGVSPSPPAPAPTAGDTPAPGAPGSVYTPNGDYTPDAQGTAPPKGDNRTSQFGLGLSAEDAYAFCGPAAAIAFAQKYGRNPSVAEAKDIAQRVGWNPNQGMAGVRSEQALLQAMGVPVKLEASVDWNHVAQDAASGNPVIVSTPGHYFYVTDYDPAKGYFVGTSGTDLKAGSQWMSAERIQAVMGRASGALYADNPTTPGPSPTANPSGAFDSFINGLGQAKDAVTGAVGDAAGGAVDAAGRGKDALVAQVQSPDTGNPVADAIGTGFSALGTGVKTAAEAARNITPTSELARGATGMEQLVAENRGLLDQQQELVRAYADAIQRGDVDTMQAIAQQMNAVQAQLTPVNRDTVHAAADRNPSTGPIEMGANIAGGLGAGRLAAEGAPLLARAAATALDPLTGAPTLLRKGVGDAGAEAADVSAGSASRFYHGTGADFPRPDPGKFDPNGLYGPGYYLTDDARVASAYAGQHTSALADLQDEISQLRRDLSPNGSFSSPVDRANRIAYAEKTLPKLEEELRQASSASANVRSVDVPAGLNLLDVETPGGRAIWERAEGPDRDGAAAARTLVAMGYDGIRYAGGKRIPLRGEDGAAITHTALSIFPESLDKLTNALSGTAGGFAAARGAATLGGGAAGGVAGYNADPNADQPTRIRNAAIGAGAGALATEGLSRVLGAVGRLAGEDLAAPAATELNAGLTPKAVGESAGKVGDAFNQVFKPIENVPPPVKGAIQDFANVVGPDSRAARVTADTLRAEVQRVLGPADSEQAVDLIRSFEKTGEFSASPTPEQAALAAKLRTFFQDTGDAGRAAGYIRGDITQSGPFPGAWVNDISELKPGQQVFHGEDLLTVARITKSGRLLAGDGTPGGTHFLDPETLRLPQAGPNNYFPHIYEDAADAATKPAGAARNFNPNDFYSKGRTLPTIDDAVAAGKTPVSVSDAVGQYAERVTASEAKAQLVRDLQAADPASVAPITPGTPIPPGMVPGTSIDKATFSPLAQYAFDPEIARVLGNIVSASDARSTPLGRAWFTGLSEAKQTIFTLSNFHTFTEGLWSYLTSPRVGNAYVHAFADPKWFQGQRFGPMATTFERAARAGVTGLTGRAPDAPELLGNPMVAAGVRAAVGGIGGAGAGYTETKMGGGTDDQARNAALASGAAGAILGPTLAPKITARLWESAIPMAKATAFDVLSKQMPGQMAADAVNRTFGGLNYAAFGRSRTLQDALRSVVQAPDWNESTLRQLGTAFFGRDQGAGFSRGLLIRAVLGTVGATEALNYALNGHFTDQNEAGHQFEVQIPVNGSRHAYVGLAPGNLQAFMNLTLTRNLGGFVHGRLSTPMQLLEDATTGKDYAGRDIVPKGTPPAMAGLRTGANLASNLSPIGIDQVATASQNGLPLGAGIVAAALGLNLRYGPKAKLAPVEKPRQSAPLPRFTAPTR